MNVYHIRETLKTMSIYDVNLRVVYYARVSTDKEEQKNSIKNQKNHFEELISLNSRWIFCGGYVDDGISGIHTAKREEFQRMMEDAKKGKFDLIITKEISRFARNTLDSIQYTRELLNYGVCVWFQNDNINTIDDDSEFRLTIMAGVAQDEIRKLSSRVKFGHAQSIKNGVVLGNSHIYGYNKENGRLTINEDEAPMVRMIFEKYATGEWTTPKLEKLLYDMGYRNYKGGKINRGVIQHIITNPKYKGWYAGGKVKIIDMFTKKQEFLPENEWHMFKDDGSRVPAIVSEEVWELANNHFKVRSEAIKNHRTSFKNGNLFTGKIFCVNDGAPYWMKQHQVRGKEDVKWVCSHRIKNGAQSCSSFGVAESELKIMLSDIIRESSLCIEKISENYISIYKKVFEQMSNNSKYEIDNMEKRIKSIRKKMDKLLEYNLNGFIEDEEFILRNTEYSNQIKEIQNQIHELQEHSLSNDGNDKISMIFSKIKEYSEIMPDDITPQVVEAMVDHIEINPLGNYHASIKFVLSCGDIHSQIYKNKRNRNIQEHNMCRSDNMVKPKKRPANPHESSMGCSGHLLLNMYSEQHMDFTGILENSGINSVFPERKMEFYREKLNYIGFKTIINYTYRLAI